MSGNNKTHRKDSIGEDVHMKVGNSSITNITKMNKKEKNIRKCNIDKENL